jgi:hypothetical protein
MAKLSRRAALAAIAAIAAGGGLLGVGCLVRNIVDTTPSGPSRSGMGGVSRTDMGRYMNMFMRHGELRRMVEDVPGGIRTTTESDAPDLVAELQAHVSSMYSHLDQRAEVSCMSFSLPTLFGHAANYQREITFTANGVVAVETASDPDLTRAIREHAREVSGFVDEGMPAMMRDMMGNGMMRGMRP